jgi:hypothetical protein
MPQLASTALPFYEVNSDIGADSNKYDDVGLIEIIENGIQVVLRRC